MADRDDPTEVLPAGAEPVAPRRRRAWLGWLVAFGVVVVLAIAAAAVLGVVEANARERVEERVRSEVQAVLPSAAVDVELSRAPVVWDVVRGELTSIDVHATIPAAEVPRTIGTMLGIDPAALSLEGETVRLASAFDVPVLGSVTLGIGLEARAEAGAIVLTPTAVLIGENQVTPDELRGMPFLGEAVAPLLEPRTVCIADRLPEALRLGALSVSETAGLEVTISGTEIPLSEEALAVRGTCS